MGTVSKVKSTQCTKQVKQAVRTVKYQEIKGEIMGWPEWKKDAYNSLATSVHASKMR